MKAKKRTEKVDEKHFIDEIKTEVNAREYFDVLSKRIFLPNQNIRGMILLSVTEATGTAAAPKD